MKNFFQILQWTKVKAAEQMEKWREVVKWRNGE